jgi:hypothetical protein
VKARVRQKHQLEEIRGRVEVSGVCIQMQASGNVVSYIQTKNPLWAKLTVVTKRNALRHGWRLPAPGKHILMRFELLESWLVVTNPSFYLAILESAISAAGLNAKPSLLNASPYFQDSS